MMNRVVIGSVDLMSILFLLLRCFFLLQVIATSFRPKRGHEVIRALIGHPDLQFYDVDLTSKVVMGHGLSRSYGYSVRCVQE